MSGATKQIRLDDLLSAERRKLTLINEEKRRLENPEEAKAEAAEAALKQNMLTAIKMRGRQLIAPMSASESSSTTSIQAPVVKSASAPVAKSTKAPKALSQKRAKPVAAEKDTDGGDDDDEETPAEKRRRAMIEGPDINSAVAGDDDDESQNNEKTIQLDFLPKTAIGRSKTIAQSVGLASNASTSSQREPCVAPDMSKMKKNDRKPGGQKDTPGIYFQATYENSAVLAGAIGTCHIYDEELYQLTFRGDGLTIMITDNGHALHLKLHVPTTSFVKYDSLCGSALSFVISSRKMKAFAKMCRERDSLTFYRKQNGDSKEPLQLILCNRNGDFDAGSVTIATFKNNESTAECIEPRDPHQFQLTLSARVYAEKLRYLAVESGEICIEASSENFKLSSLDPDGGGDLACGIPVKKTLEAALDVEGCFIERVADSDQRILLNALPAMRFIAPYLVSMTHFGSKCDRVVLRLGLRSSAARPGAKEESNLFVCYTLGSDGAPFTVKMWLAPLMDD